MLDPQEGYGSDFPRETFRVLKEKEMKAYGDAAQSDEATRVGEVGRAQRTASRIGQADGNGRRGRFVAVVRGK
jgi:hypothetical protein